jgi:hypothetical protein
MSGVMTELGRIMPVHKRILWDRHPALVSIVAVVIMRIMVTHQEDTSLTVVSNLVVMDLNRVVTVKNIRQYLGTTLASASPIPNDTYGRVAV